MLIRDDSSSKLLSIQEQKIHIIPLVGIYAVDLNDVVSEKR